MLAQTEARGAPNGFFNQVARRVREQLSKTAVVELCPDKDQREKGRLVRVALRDVCSQVLGAEKVASDSLVDSINLLKGIRHAYSMAESQA